MKVYGSKLLSIGSKSDALIPIPLHFFYSPMGARSDTSIHISCSAGGTLYLISPLLGRHVDRGQQKIDFPKKEHA